MTQHDLHCALSRATGESVRAIRRFGFSLVDPDVPATELEFSDVGPQTVDWDRLETDRLSLAVQA